MQILREELVPLLRAGLGLPEGATLTAVADELEHDAPELADILRQVEQETFRPGAGATLDLPRLRRSVLRLTASGLVVIGLAQAVGATGHVAEADALFAAAAEAYGRGDPGGAYQLYEALRAEGCADASILYNQANCLALLGRLGEALALYEQAMRLAPRDLDIAENRRFVHARLGLGPRSVRAPPVRFLASLRDRLRPDEWLLAAAVLFFLGCVSASMLRLRRRPAAKAAAVAAVAVTLCVCALWSQLRGPYRAGVHAVVVVPGGVPVYRLPSLDSALIAFDLREGETIRILGVEGAWLRVQAGESQAWLRAEDSRLVW
jgi:tetratricopeptide (TPR) repeat protein